MASRIFSSAFLLPRTPLFAAAIGITGSAALYQQLHSARRNALRLDSSPVHANPKDWSFSQYTSEASTPLTTSSGGLNAKAVRQLSLGSILGLASGLTISLFSKPLVLLIGILVVGVQTAESYGIRLVPYGRFQRYFKNIDLRSAVQDNVALKLSFGTMFALSAFAEF